MLSAMTNILGLLFTQENQANIFFQEFVVKMWSNQENRVRKQVKNSCEVVAYAMRSSGKSSLAVGLSPYKIAKKDVLASKLAGRFFTILHGS